MNSSCPKLDAKFLSSELPDMGSVTLRTLLGHSSLCPPREMDLYPIYACIVVLFAFKAIL